jgi:hypothetical protein
MVRSGGVSALIPGESIHNPTMPGLTERSQNLTQFRRTLARNQTGFRCQFEKSVHFEELMEQR